MPFGLLPSAAAVTWCCWWGMGASNAGRAEGAPRNNLRQQHVTSCYTLSYCVIGNAVRVFREHSFSGKKQYKQCKHVTKPLSYIMMVELQGLQRHLCLSGSHHLSSWRRERDRHDSCITVMLQLSRPHKNMPPAACEALAAPDKQLLCLP